MADIPNPISITKGHIYPLSSLTATPAPPESSTAGLIRAGLAVASDHLIADASGDQSPLEAGKVLREVLSTEPMGTAPEVVATGGEYEAVPSSGPDPGPSSGPAPDCKYRPDYQDDPVSYTADPNLLEPEPLKLAVKVGSVVKVLVGFGQVVCGEVVQIRDEPLGSSGVHTGALVATVNLDPPYPERTACVSVDKCNMQLATGQLSLASRVDTFDLVAGLGKVLYSPYPLSRAPCLTLT